ncbi:hypothetical protein Vretifemale_15570, partial [Volvox reticuliferus]
NLRGMEVEMVTAVANGRGGNGTVSAGCSLRALQHGTVLQPPPPAAAAATATAGTVAGGAVGSVCAGLKDIPLLTSDAVRHQHHHHSHPQCHLQNCNNHNRHSNRNNQQVCNRQQQEQQLPPTLNLISDNGQQGDVVEAAGTGGFPPPHLPEDTSSGRLRPQSADGGRPSTPLLLRTGGGGGGAVSDIDEDADDGGSIFTAASGLGGADSGISFHSAASPHESYISAASSPVSRISVSLEDAADSGFLYRAVHPPALMLPENASCTPPPHRPRTPGDGSALQHRHSNHHPYNQHHNHQPRYQTQGQNAQCYATAAGMAAAAAAVAVGGVPYAGHEHARVQGSRPEASVTRAIDVPSRGATAAAAASEEQIHNNGRYAALTPPATSPADGGTERRRVAAAAAAAAPGWGPSVGGITAAAPPPLTSQVPNLGPRRSSDPLAWRGPLHREFDRPYAATRGGGVGPQDRFGSGGNGGFGSAAASGNDDDCSAPTDAVDFTATDRGAKRKETSVIDTAAIAAAAAVVKESAGHDSAGGGGATGSGQHNNDVLEEAKPQQPTEMELKDAYSLLDLSLVTDLMQGLAVGPTVAPSHVAADAIDGVGGGGGMSGRPQPPPLAPLPPPAAAAAASGYLDKAAVDAPTPLEASRPPANGTRACFSGENPPLPASALATATAASSELQRGGGSLRETGSTGGGSTGGGRSSSASGSADTWRAESLPSPSAIDACAASVAAAVAGSGAASGGAAAGSTPFTARMREGLQRIKSGVETMLRQAPLPAVPSMPFLQGSSPPLTAAAAAGGGDVASVENGPGAASSDPDAAMFGIQSTARGQSQPQGPQQQPTQGSQVPCPQGKGQWLFLVEADREVFERMILIPASVSDHLPDAYFQRLRQLVKGSSTAAAAAVATAAASRGSVATATATAASAGLTAAREL